MQHIIKKVAATLLLVSTLPVYAADLDIKPILVTDKAWNQTTLPPYTGGQPEIHVVKFRIAPGTKTPVHMHPVNGAGYVLSGELTMYATTDPHGDFVDQSKVKKTILRSGDAWTETVNTWHYGVNNGAKDVEFIVVFAGQKDMPVGMSLSEYKEHNHQQ